MTAQTTGTYVEGIYWPKGSTRFELVRLLAGPQETFWLSTGLAYTSEEAARVWAQSLADSLGLPIRVDRVTEPTGRWIPWTRDALEISE